MQTQRAVDKRPPQWCRGGRPRATARRASTRRATARQRKGDVEGCIIQYLKNRPQSTVGDIAKGLNAHPATIAAGLSHLSRIRSEDVHGH
jgi:hypothetical protein